MTGTFVSHAHVGALAATAGILFACAGDNLPREVAGPLEPPHVSQIDGGGRGFDEEIMGYVTATDSAAWTAHLSPAGNLPPGASESVPVGFGIHDSTSRDWGWFDVNASDGGCMPRGVASKTEVHRFRTGQLTHDSVVGSDTLETHCVEAGTSFLLDLLQGETLRMRREIDWIAWTRVIVGENAFYVHDEVRAGGEYFDVLANFNQVGGTDTVAPAVEITATQSATATSWVPLSADTLDTKYHIPENFVVRLGAWTTTSTAPENTILVRYFWNHGQDSTRTGFISLQGLLYLGLVRAHRYSKTSPFDHTIRAHFVLPHQVPSPVDDVISTDYGKTLDLNLHIEDSLTAVIAAEDTVAIGDTVHFADPGQDGGGLLGRLWTFGDGDSATTATPPHAYATAGTKTVILTKTHAYHGLQVADTATVVILPALDAGVIVGSYDGWPTNNEIEEGGDCMWEVNPTGGTGSYTYVW